MTTYSVELEPQPAPVREQARPRPGVPGGWLVAAALCLAHGAGIGVGMGGWSGISSPWPLALHDHPIHFHSAVITRQFLRASGTTAGYDPSFMAGYAKSVIFPASSTLPEVFISLFGASHPVQAYKVCVLLAACMAPWVLLAGLRAWGAGGGAAAVAVGLWLVYVWTDFPISYVPFGMFGYFLSIPLGLATTGAIARFLQEGGLRWWLLAATGSAVVVLVHLTSAMVVAPAAALAYAVAWVAGRRTGQPLRAGQHLGVWLIPPLVLAANAFWWLPGIWLASTKGPSDFAFAHTESVLNRLAEILTKENPVQVVLISLGLPGVALLARRDPVRAAALLGFAAAGFFWGYLAGAFRALDFLQPGRHTYAFYTGAAVAAGLAVCALLSRLKKQSHALAFCAGVGLVLLSCRLFGPAMVASARARLSEPEPFLSSEPSPRLTWVLDRVRTHVRPGERLLYEEGGFGLPGLPEPFRYGRFSGLLPYFTGVEVLGGPYLHAALTTNFTQFGEAKLFGKTQWDADHFRRYARLYRPTAIVCWTPWARGFCKAHPELIEVLDTQDLGPEGTILIGRVRGFEGVTIEGTATVEAKPGRLTVSAASAELDGMVVLRYHHVPCLRSRPPVRLEPVSLEGDPVPFIGLRPTPGPVTLELKLPP